MICSNCKLPFERNTKGKSSLCHPCKREYDRVWYAKNRDRLKERKRETATKRRELIREWITQYLLDHPCVDCGEPDPVVLEFDHRGDKNHNVADMPWSYGLEAVRREVAKCDVRCANCHRRKTHQQQAMAQFGSAPASDAGGRKFDSS